MHQLAYLKAVVCDLKQHGLIYSCLLSGLCVLCGWYLAGFSQQRRDELQHISATITSELIELRRLLAQVSLELIEDPVLARSVSNHKPNTYSAKLKDRITHSSGAPTHISIFTTTCKPYYQTHPQLNTLDCNPDNLDKFIWRFDDSQATIAITRKLNSQFLITTAQDITAEWISALPIDLSQHQLQANLTEAAALTSLDPPQLTYIYSSGLHITDIHPLSGWLKAYVSPYGTHRFPLQSYIILFILNIIGLLYRYYRQFNQLATKLSAITDEVSQYAIGLGMDPATSLSQTLNQFSSQLYEAQTTQTQHTLKINSLNRQNHQQQITIAQLSSIQHLQQEVQRNAKILANQLHNQQELEDNTKDFLELLHSLTLHPLSQILQKWQLDLVRRGPRKFLRSSLEVMAETDRKWAPSNQSVFEQDIEKLMTTAEKITLLTHSLLKHSHDKSRKNEQLEKMVRYWMDHTQLSEPQPLLSSMIDYAAWQVRHGHAICLKITRPHWLEPPPLSPSFGETLRYVIYEIFAYLTRATAHDSTGDSIHFTVHYVPEPAPGILMTQNQPLKPASSTSETALTKLHDMIATYTALYGLSLDHQPRATPNSPDHLTCTYLSWHQNTATTQSIANPPHMPSQALPETSSPPLPPQS